MEFLAQPYSDKIEESTTRELSEARRQTVRALTTAAGANKEAGSARKYAGNAEQQASQAIERAAANEREAARLNKLAEDEGVARANIESLIQWRTLTEEQKDKIRGSLPTSFVGTKIAAVTSVMGDGEGAQYAADLVDALRKCAWVVDDPVSGMFGGALPEVCL